MKSRHNLLKRQIKRHFGEEFSVPAEWEGLLGAINDAYAQFDDDRLMLERSLDLSSQELMQANSEMRALFQAIPDLLFRLDRDGRIIDFKAGATGDLLLPARELFGKRIQDIPIKAIGDQITDALQQVREKKCMVNIEYSLTLRGQECFYEARFVPLPENQIVAIIRNITERRHAEAMRVGQNQILEMIATGAPLEQTLTDLMRLIESQSGGMLCSVLLVDKDGQHLRYGAAPSLPESYIHATDGVVIGPRSGSCGTAAHRKQTVIVTDILQDPLWERAREVATQHHLRACWSTPILGRQGEVLGTFAMYYREPRSPKLAETRLINIATRISGIAITRKQSEESLLKLLRVVDQTADYVLIADRNGIIEYANPSFEAMTGYAKEEVLGRTPRLLKSGNEYTEFYTNLWTQILSGKVYRGVLTDRKKNGDLFDAELTITPIKDDSGHITHFVSTGKDVTERKELEAQLRQMQKMDAFGQLAAGVAHDFNNILTVIQGNADLLRTRQLEEKGQCSAIEEISRAAERAANLTRQLLTFSRRQPIQLKDLDLNEVVGNITKILQRLIGEHIELEAHYAPGGAPVRADPGMMEQLLMNLAVNSRDAMPKSGRLILRTRSTIVNEADTRLRPRARPGEFVELSVADTGTGISPENLQHIFEPFFTTKDTGKGTGLGLATVFGIVDQHHGWIEVESRPDQGTTFRIYLPRLNRTVAAASEELSAAPEMRGGSETILLVEDEVPVRQLMQVILSGHGYQVHEAASGVAAFAVWAQHRDNIHLLLTDMMMPGGVGGRELAERLLSEKPDLKVLYCSGYSDDALGENSPLRNKDNFLEKPFECNRLLQKVRNCLDKT